LNEYEKPEEIVRAYEALSKADLFRTRIAKRQHWKLLRYMVELMTSGVALSKQKTYRKFTKYKYPSRLIVLGRSKTERREEKEELLKLSEILHCSTKKIRKEFLPYIKIWSK
jgi:replication factor C large subunit